MADLPPVVTTIPEVRAAVREARAEGRAIGLVPTMGALHEGHARLIEACRAEVGFVVASIFVNPAQFGPNEDFAKYPRALEADRRLCGRSGADLIFHPGVEEMYPHGAPETFVEVTGLSTILEGAFRPIHFRGVATVVTKLLQIVQPDLAHFGQKDFQQLKVIQKMVADLDMPVTIRPVATVREPDGLAMSSRNAYLNAPERQAALVLSAALHKAAEAVEAGVREADRVRQILRETIESEPLATLDYAEVADAATLAPRVELAPGRPAVALLAVRVGPARLIDNAILPEISTEEPPH